LECAEIRSGFVAGRVPAGSGVDAHLKECAHCRELFARDAELGRRLAQAVLPAPEPGDLFAQIDRDVGQERGLRAKLRAWPLRTRLATLWIVALLLPVSSVLARGPTEGSIRPNYSVPMLYAIAIVLLAAYRRGGSWLLRGATVSAAGGKDRLIALGLLLLPAAVLAFSPMGARSPEALAAFGNPANCFGYGALLSLPVVVLYWLFERRDRVPLAGLVAAGGLAGLAANVLLHVHCASAHLGHLLLGHATIGVAWALVIAALARPLQLSR
jgi:hypothetical protein